MSDAATQPVVVAHIIKTITRNQKDILDALGEEPIAVYQFLSSEAAKGGVDRNPLFQFVYRSFYRLDTAGLTPAFKRQYFTLMEGARNAGSIDLTAITTDLYQYETLRKHKSLQFSFVTKLAATVDPSYPIYDRAVGTALGFPPPAGGKAFAKGLARNLQFYAWLRGLYANLLSNPTALPAMAALTTQYPRAATIPPTKLLDFIFWSAGKLELVLVP